MVKMMNNKYSMAQQLEWPHNWEDKRASEFWPTVKGMGQILTCGFGVGYIVYEAIRPWI